MSEASELMEKEYCYEWGESDLLESCTNSPGGNRGLQMLLSILPISLGNLTFLKYLCMFLRGKSNQYNRRAISMSHNLDSGGQIPL